MKNVSDVKYMVDEKFILKEQNSLIGIFHLI